MRSHSLAKLEACSSSAFPSMITRMLILINSIREYSKENSQLKFYCSVRLNGVEVGRGVGSNKKQAKLIASQVGLQNVSPTLYEEWRSKLGHLT